LRRGGLKVRLLSDEWLLLLLVCGYGGCYWFRLGAACTTCHWFSGAAGGVWWGCNIRCEIRIVTFFTGEWLFRLRSRRLGFRLQEVLALLLLVFLRLLRRDRRVDLGSGRGWFLD
jgi:hypothetical protein